MRGSPHPGTGIVNTLRRALTPNPYIYGNLQFCKVHAVHTHSVDLIPTGLTGLSTYTATTHMLKKVRWVLPYGVTPSVHKPTIGDIVVVLRGGYGGQATTLIVLGKFA